MVRNLRQIATGEQGSRRVNLGQMMETCGPEISVALGTR
jgi:hypothetical protein